MQTVFTTSRQVVLSTSSRLPTTTPFLAITADVTRQPTAADGRLPSTQTAVPRTPLHGGSRGLQKSQATISLSRWAHSSRPLTAGPGYSTWEARLCTSSDTTWGCATVAQPQVLAQPGPKREAHVEYPGPAAAVTRGCALGATQNGLAMATGTPLRRSTEGLSR